MSFTVFKEFKKNISNKPAIVWDAGGVIVDFSPTNMANSFKGGLYKEQVLDLFNSPYWKQFDRGDLTLSGLKTICCEKFGLKTYEMDELFDFFLASLKPKHETIALIQLFKKLGYDQYYLSNGSKEYLAYLKSQQYRDKYKFDIRELFDDKSIIISADINISKPEPEIFDIATMKFNLKGRTVYFFDDMQVNIDAAIKHGWNGVLFEDVRSVLRVFRDPEITSQFPQVVPLRSAL